MKTIKSFLIFTVLLFITVTISSCSKPESEYAAKVEAYRAHKDSLMRFAENSPFNYKEKVEFHPLKYYDVDTNFVFKSKLHLYPEQDTITVYGTKGEKRKAIKFGFLKIKDEKLNVYKNLGSGGEIYYGVWFTDGTTNETTYGVGRYLDFEYVPDSNFVYTIDFNYAYNPYCAYSSAYSCAIPTKEDHLNMKIEAGEKKFHD
jgi:uncharacterized protein (DUF1684 family)